MTPNKPRATPELATRYHHPRGHGGTPARPRGAFSRRTLLKGAAATTVVTAGGSRRAAAVICPPPTDDACGDRWMWSWSGPVSPA